MIAWASIIYGALLSGVAASILVALALRERRLAVLATAALAAVLGPLVWNAILRDANSDGFFVDAPVAVLPASWQDTGSGAFALATSALALWLGPLRAGTGRRTALTAALAGSPPSSSTSTSTDGADTT